VLVNTFKEETYIQAFIIGLNCLLITLFAYISIKLFYSVITEHQVGHRYNHEFIAEASGTDQGLQTPGIKPFSSYEVVSSRNLFGVMDHDVESQPDDVSDLELTDLSLKLHGTMVNRQGPSYAVLEDTRDRRKKARLIMENEAIGDAVLTSVYRDKVVLTVNGSRQVLMLEEYISRSGRYRAPSRTAYMNRKPIQQTRTVRKRDIDKAMANMGSFLKQARIRPHVTNGVADGFRITSIKSRSLFQKLGLRNGDIIMGVNGQDIRSADDAMAFYQDLSAGRDLAIKLRRRGRDRVITYRIR
jgi:general secretion pathway protein C